MRDSEVVCRGFPDVRTAPLLPPLLFLSVAVSDWQPWPVASRRLSGTTIERAPENVGKGVRAQSG